MRTSVLALVAALLLAGCGDSRERSQAREELETAAVNLTSLQRAPEPQTEEGWEVIDDAMCDFSRKLEHAREVGVPHIVVYDDMLNVAISQRGHPLLRSYRDRIPQVCEALTYPQ